MRTTIRINNDLLKRAKKQAADEGRTLTSLVEDGLALILSKPKTSRRKRVELPVSKATGGILLSKKPWPFPGPLQRLVGLFMSHSKPGIVREQVQ
jgi:hypothetical protein